ncbi:MAG: PadR family transcriptional regulator [Acidobacteriia bacterium]|nr:PadR family transcriptional regulator [Terriglobia bacterium]
MSASTLTSPPSVCVGFGGIVNFKGALPALILETVRVEPNHGYRIAQLIKERSGGLLDFKEGTLYPALHKLENGGLVESYEGAETGRTRRYYRITKAGRGALARDRDEWRELSRAVTMILGET